MAVLDSNLEGPLRKIARLAIRRETTERHVADLDLDLFNFKNSIGRDTADAIVEFLRAEVETSTGRTKTVRLATNSLGRPLRDGNFVTCAVCTFGAPEGMLMRAAPNVFVFIVAGGCPGYLTL